MRMFKVDMPAMTQFLMDLKAFLMSPKGITAILVILIVSYWLIRQFIRTVIKPARGKHKN